MNGASSYSSTTYRSTSASKDKYTSAARCAGLLYLAVAYRSDHVHHGPDDENHRSRVSDWCCIGLQARNPDDECAESEDRCAAARYGRAAGRDYGRNHHQNAAADVQPCNPVRHSRSVPQKALFHALSMRSRVGFVTTDATHPSGRTINTTGGFTCQRFGGVRIVTCGTASS